MTQNNPTHDAKTYLVQLEPALMILKPITDKNLAANCSVKNSANLTYLHLLENKLQEALEKAEQADLIKTEFVQNIQHSIRTPFNGIWSLVNILHEQETDPQKKEYLGNISECAKELLDYCNNILEFSKVSLGFIPIVSRKFSLNDLVGKVITKVTPEAKSKGLELIVDVPKDTPDLVIGDEYRLHEILMHLMNNAVKFTAKGSVSLTVKAVHKEENRRVIIQFIVQDTGIGISEEKQQYIYEQFTRLTPCQ